MLHLSSVLIHHYDPPLLLHVLELVDPPLGVALPDLPEGLVLVPTLLHVLLVDPVHRRLPRVVPIDNDDIDHSLEEWLTVTVKYGLYDPVGEYSEALSGKICLWL